MMVAIINLGHPGCCGVYSRVALNRGNMVCTLLFYGEIYIVGTHNTAYIHVLGTDHSNLMSSSNAV